MSTPLTDRINALTIYSNTVTGASDTTLSEAVATLAAGYADTNGWSYERITIGPNEMTRISDIEAYINHTNFMLCKVGACSVYNEIYCVVNVNDIGVGGRYRDGTYSAINYSGGFVAAYVEGSVYDVFYKD